MCVLNYDECVYCGEDGYCVYDCERFVEYEREIRVRLKLSVKDMCVKMMYEDYCECLKCV